MLHLFASLESYFVFFATYIGGFLTPFWINTVVLSVLVTMGLVVIISIDHPFTDPVYIHPDSLALVLADHQPPK